MQHARENEAEEAVEGVRNSEGGTGSTDGIGRPKRAATRVGVDASFGTGGGDKQWVDGPEKPDVSTADEGFWKSKYEEGRRREPE